MVSREDPNSFCANYANLFLDLADQQHYFPATARDTRAVLNPISKGFSCTGASCGDSSCDDDGKRFLDNYETIFRDCDKLIESFMLHETDWRKFIILNKKWSNVRPHFFRHCQDKADAVDNPVLKNKLLWLGKKLKEVFHCLFDIENYTHHAVIMILVTN